MLFPDRFLILTVALHEDYIKTYIRDLALSAVRSGNAAVQSHHCCPLAPYLQFFPVSSHSGLFHSGLYTPVPTAQ